MYSSRTGLNNLNSREWVSWKQVMLHLLLINSTLPTEKELATLRVNLSEAGEAQMVDKEAFRKVSTNSTFKHFCRLQCGSIRRREIQTPLFSTSGLQTRTLDMTKALKKVTMTTNWRTSWTKSVSVPSRIPFSIFAESILARKSSQYQNSLTLF